jgi:hypothetical protein
MVAVRGFDRLFPVCYTNFIGAMALRPAEYRAQTLPRRLYLPAGAVQGGAAVRRIVSVLLLAAFLSGAVPVPGRAGGDGVTVCRALLVACDFFLSQVSTWPSAAVNVSALAAALRADARGYAVIRTENGTLSDRNMLRDAIRETFSAADADDISLLYISTHGLFVTSGAEEEPALLLSDGGAEDTATAAFLYSSYAGIAGAKVLVLDACQSGAFIGKGMWEEAASYFYGPEWKVLTSSGGSEKSFYWQSANKQVETLRGGSYFAGALLDGIGYTGVYAADANGDGMITLLEMFGYLTENHAASTPCCYPQQDDAFVFFACGPLPPDTPGKAVSDIILDDAVLTAGESQAQLSYTVNRPVRLAYQLIYFRDGAWQFADAQIIQTEDAPDGLTQPGRKQTTLNLDTEDANAFGYVLVQLITLEEDAAVMEGARLLCVQPPAGDPGLTLQTEPAFSPGSGREIALRVTHAFPCSITVRVLDSRGAEVRRICNRLPSRPQRLSAEGSVFYWDGHTNAGALAPAGEYMATAAVILGDAAYSAASAPFILE